MKNSPSCPIRLQGIPGLGELDPVLPPWAVQASREVYGQDAPWRKDPIGDLARLQTQRLTHRYGNRAILHFSSTCAVNCRFCFRRTHLSTKEEALYEGSLESAYRYLESCPEIQELILTGGDPLSATDPTLQRNLERVNRIHSIKVVRIHSRMAVTLPGRFTPDLVACLGRPWNFRMVLVSHFNHPFELSPASVSALTDLRKAGVVLLNQSVLLRNVNDSLETLADLFQGLYHLGVVPYYLHHTDWTPGTFHFRVSVEKGRELHASLRGKVSGPALPDYILDLPGGGGKISLSGPGIQKVKSYGPACDDDSPESLKVAGALYQIQGPHTKTGSSSFPYLDLYFASRS